MVNKKIKIVTAIYNRLKGTSFGGRGSERRYILSLQSLMKMANAEFIIYTSEEERPIIEENLQNFTNKKIISYDLKVSDFQNLFEKYKNYEEAKTSDRCVEIQYLKFQWMKEQNFDCDYLFWIDAGLSNTALIPNKWMTHANRNFAQLQDYYYSDIFNNNFLQNLVEISNDKIFVILKENIQNAWSHQPEKFINNQYDYKWHTISGLFGGNSNVINQLYNLFYDYSFKIAENYKMIWYEENILTVIFYNHPELFETKFFYTWWHEDTLKSEHIGGNSVEDFLIENKSFYKILEEIYNKN